MDFGEEASPGSGSSHDVHRSKKKRLAGACDACRKRKSAKGDSAQMGGEPCTHCQTTGIKCAHDLPRQPTKSEIAAAYIDALEAKVKHTDKMYRLLQKVYPGQDIDSLLASLPDVADDGHNEWDVRPETSTKELSPHLDFSHPISKAIPGDTTTSKILATEESEDNAEEDDLSHIALSKHFDQLKISADFSQGWFFGSASLFMLMKHCSDVKTEFTGLKSDGSNFRRPTFWSPRPWEIEYARASEPRYVYPDERLLHSLVALYFEKVNPFMPLLHRPTFLRMLLEKQHLQDVSFGTTVIMVCALGARYSSDPQVNLPSDPSGLSAGWQYFRQVPLHPHGFSHVPTLYDLQYYSLAHVYLLSSSVPHVAWNILGLAIQSALSRGAHRRRKTCQQPSKEEELMKRAFWCLIFLDRVSSGFVGRPCVIADEDFDLDYPIECDDEYWETDDPKQAFKQPPGKACTITSFVHMLKLLEILAFAHRTLYSTKKSKVLSGLIEDGWEQRIVAQLDSSMNQWKDSMPDSVRWDPERPDLVIFHQSMILHIVYSYTQIQIHRPFLTKKSPMSFASLAICTNAARSCAHVLEGGISRGIKASPIMITGALIAGLIISLNLWGSRRSGLIRDPGKEIRDLQTCFNVLKEAEKRWHTAGRANDMLNEASFLVNDYQMTHNKRRRDSSQMPRQPATPEYPQSDRSFSKPSMSTFPPNDYNPPLDAALGISDWDILLLQMGHIQPTLDPSSSPTVFQTNHNSTSSLSHHMKQDSVLVPEDSVTDDLFSLWSDVPGAFSQDEWDTYLADLGNSSYL
ncbi:hypothetical protein HYPSUDRAFT_42806 [Hypholoma sublateritium FD-334 SS-4]|uniref:Xylanolytic transcriptional activator regulatory domain-containing protein n=1 Tax=Hypholoma sublateritium (strain FD-334 SS-4) TaxID=945553 RepID=A0A0D2L271_HYPSF|nr:hypothetical protein HYPSUDRAFT_42806 [Hypholoma sublateritium FD-334 SS-4]